MEAVKATIQTNHPSGMELISSSSRDSSLPGGALDSMWSVEVPVGLAMVMICWIWGEKRYFDNPELGLNESEVNHFLSQEEIIYHCASVDNNSGIIRVRNWTEDVENRPQTIKGSRCGEDQGKRHNPFITAGAPGHIG